MAKKTINLGNPDQGNGDPLRTAFDKVNDNFNELYSLVGGTSAELEEIAQDYAANMFTSATHSGVSVTYNDAANTLSITTDFDGSYNSLTDKPSFSIDLSAIDQSIIPDTDVTYDLGSATNRFRDLYLSGSSIDLGGTVLSVAGGVLQIGGTSIADVARAAVADGSTGFNYNEVDGTSEIGVTADIFDFGDGKTIDMQNSTIIFTGSTITGLEVQPTGDLTGSVFADDSTLLVDGVNGKIVGPVDTATITASALNLNISARNYVYVDSNEGGSIVIGQTASTGPVVVGRAGGIFTVESDAYFNGGIITNSIASPATGNLELDVGRDNGGAFIVTAWEDKNDAENGWKQILWAYDTNRYSFFVGGDVDAQGSVNVSQNLNVTNNINVSSSGVITTSATDKGLIIEGPNWDDWVEIEGGGYDSISNGVNIVTHRSVTNEERVWSFSGDGALYPPFQADNYQIGTIEWRQSAPYEIVNQIRTTVGNGVDQFPGLKLFSYANPVANDHAITLQAGFNNNWIFKSDGSVIFPDATVQTTAYTAILSTEGLTDGSPASPTALSLDKQVQILSGAENEGFYSLADGVQGQVMYFTPVNSGVYVIVANARIRNTGTGAVEIVTNYSWQVDFDQANYAPRTIAMAIFVNGAWNLTGGATD